MKRLNFRRREAVTGLAFAALPLAGFIVFFAAPFLISIIEAFQKNSRFAGFQNFFDLFGSDAFQLAAGNTLRFIACGVPLIMLVSMAAALLLNRKVRHTKVLRTVFVFPYVIPVASIIMAFNVLFEQSGIVNSIGRFFGFETINFLGSDNAFYVLLFLYIWKNFGYNMLLLLAGLSQIPSEYYDAAQIDGAGKWRRLISITLPLMFPTFFFVFIISIINSFKVFREAYALGGAYPHESIYTLQHFMNNNFVNLNYSRVSVASLITFAVISVIVCALFAFQRRAGESQL